MSNIIFIGGVSCFGKYTIGKKLSEQMLIQFFEGSQVVMETFGLEMNNYIKLNNLPKELKIKGLINLYKKISNENNNSIISSHFMIMLDGEFIEYVGDWFLNCSHLIHVWNDPEVILKHIDDDVRVRKLFSE
jgi:shikimate kinase